MKRELKTSDGQNLGWKCTEDWSVRCADVLCGLPEQCENSTWLYTTVFAELYFFMWYVVSYQLKGCSSKLCLFCYCPPFLKKSISYVLFKKKKNQLFDYFKFCSYDYLAGSSNYGNQCGQKKKYTFSSAFLTLRYNSQEDNKIHYGRSCNQVNAIKLLIIFFGRTSIREDEDLLFY